MNYAEANAIYDKQDRREDWAMLSQQVQDDTLDLLNWYDARQGCCEPYDCMCHEACSWEDDIASKCGGCQEGARLHDATDKVSASQYEFALAFREIGLYGIQRDELDTIKMLEESGDYAAAARMFSGEDE